MITAAANDLVTRIQERANSLSTTASMNAVEYARNNKPEDRAVYQKYAALEREVRDMYSLVCAGLHAVEREMQQKKA